MSKHSTAVVSVKILPNTASSPAGKLADARRMAEEARQAAREAAEEAHRQAEQLASEAEQEARGADEQIAAAEGIREQSREKARETARTVQNGETNGDLSSLTKDELMDLAAGIDLHGRSGMNKSELGTAIKRKSKES